MLAILAWGSSNRPATSQHLCHLAAAWHLQLAHQHPKLVPPRARKQLVRGMQLDGRAEPQALTRVEQLKHTLTSEVEKLEPRVQIWSRSMYWESATKVSRGMLAWAYWLMTYV